MWSSEPNRRTAPRKLDQVNGGSILPSGDGSILASVEGVGGETAGEPCGEEADCPGGSCQLNFAPDQDVDTHLMVYDIKGPHQPRSCVRVGNQFGTFSFDTRRTDTLMVPASKSVPPTPASQAPDPARHEVDHYRCLLITRSPGTPSPPTRKVKVQDQFGTRTLQVKEPTRLCLPVDKNSEGVENPFVHLTCHKIKPDSKTDLAAVQTSDQFGPKVLVLRREAQLCMAAIQGRNFDVDLDIANGQAGELLDETKEDDPGAFTVANLNDTDADGKLDKDDNEVAGEVDLMQLVVRKPQPDKGGPVTLTVPPSVQLWQDATKKTKAEALALDTKDLPKTLWVEAREISTKLRDIEIKATYQGETDTVKATAVWATQTAVAHATDDAAALFDEPNAPWKDVPKSLKERITKNGGVGLRPVTERGLKNVILIRFELLPSGIGKESGVKFDITRQANGMAWQEVDGKVVFAKTIKRSKGQDDMPNDDSHDKDESEEVSEKGHFYSTDASGPSMLEAGGASLQVSRANFWEFVRVKFDGTRPTGDAVQGSRCSDKFTWHTRQRLVKGEDGKWKREDMVEPNNDIGPEHIDVVPDADPEAVKDKEKALGGPP